MPRRNRPDDPHEAEHPADELAPPVLRRNFIIYGIGGVIVPFIGIKFLDVLLVLLRLV